MGTNEIGVLAELGTLFSGGMRIMIPIGFAALGCTVSERVGIVNIGAEGMMLAGAFGGAVGSYVFGNAWMGLLCAILLGVLMASIHGLLTIKFKTGQIISGLGINMLAEGATAVLMQSIWGNRGKSPEVAALPNIRIDAVGDSSFFAPLLKSISPLLILLIVLTAVIWFWMYQTVPGLRARSIGENPKAADSAGIKVYRMQFCCVLLSGALAALGGAYLSIGDVAMFSRDMAAGRGFIALAVTILGGWTPWGAIGGSVLFGMAQSVQFRLQAYDFPVQIIQMLPYVLSILILFLVRRSRCPAYSGKNYDRQEL